MTSIATFIAAHLFWTGVIAFWVFSAAVSAMPQPASNSSGFYSWLFGFLTLVRADFAGALGSKIPGSASQAAQKGSARIGAVLLACTLSMCLLVAGCTVPPWVTKIESEMPTIIDAIGGLLPILEALNVPIAATSDIVKAQTDLTAANTLAKGFQPGSTAPLAQVQALLADAQTNISAVNAFVPADSQALVATLLQEATNEVNTIAADTAQTAVAGKFAATPAKQPLGRAVFARTWNDHIKKTGNPAVDELTAKMRLSEHGTFVHVITLYRVK